jgi:hypothetical protein
MILQKLQAGHRGFLRRGSRRGGHHRSRLLHRRPASGHEGRRRDRRVQCPPHHRRAHRCGHGLRPGRNKDQTILVYDLGGGTFDVSIIEIISGVFRVLAIHGDTQLGGDDFDKRIIDFLCDEFKREHGSTCTTIPSPCRACAKLPKRPRSNSQNFAKRPSVSKPSPWAKRVRSPSTRPWANQVRGTDPGPH